MKKYIYITILVTLILMFIYFELNKKVYTLEDYYTTGTVEDLINNKVEKNDYWVYLTLYDENKIKFSENELAFLFETNKLDVKNILLVNLGDNTNYGDNIELIEEIYNNGDKIDIPSIIHINSNQIVDIKCLLCNNNTIQDMFDYIKNIVEE